MWSEKDDMDCPKRTSVLPLTGRRTAGSRASAAHRITRSSHHDVDRPLRCVSSGYLDGGCPCRETVPLGVVTAAWSREIGRSSIPRSGFFQFVWEDRVWLGFGLEDGQVRGVYCPDHAAQRAQRSVAQPRQDRPAPDSPAGSA